MKISKQPCLRDSTANPRGMIGTPHQHNRGDTRTRRSTQSTITLPSGGGDFYFESFSTPASSTSTSPLSTCRASIISLGNSSSASRTQDCRSPPFLSNAQAFQLDVVEMPSYTLLIISLNSFLRQAASLWHLLNLHVCFLCHFPTRTISSRYYDNFT
jgi:hypothetical protein